MIQLLRTRKADHRHGKHGRIFEFICSSREGRDEEGTKVGLTILRWIIERHSGRIWVGSAKG